MVDKKVIDLQAQSSGMLGTGRGYGFGDWITGRSSGYSSGSLIEQPTYIFESIIRDEILVERDLKASSSSTYTNYIEFNGSSNSLLNTTVNYYQNAYLHSVNGDWTKLITYYDGSNKRVYANSLSVSEAPRTGDDFFITNINANINTSSFDAVGNTTNGTRNGWKFGKSINAYETSQNTLNDLCFESHCMLFKSYKNWKLVALDSGTSVGTFLNPSVDGGRPKMAVGLTSLDNVYTEFKLSYNYDYAKNDYIKTAYIDKNGSSNSTYLGSTEQALCRSAETNYRTRKVFDHKSQWIYDDTTAYKLLQKWVNYFTKQKLIVTYWGDVKNHIKYEIGDLVKINYSDMIPTSKNNSTIFMIKHKSIRPIKQGPQIEFKLLEMV